MEPSLLHDADHHLIDLVPPVIAIPSPDPEADPHDDQGKIGGEEDNKRRKTDRKSEICDTISSFLQL